jgi:microcompartment protein CcmK/EutM
MFLAKVIGITWSNHKHYSYEGIEIKIIQDINPQTGDLTGKPFFALDAVSSSVGETVAYEISFQAGQAFDNATVLSDATITAIIDSINVDESYKNDNR